jgi:hypothetical protein
MKVKSATMKKILFYCFVSVYTSSLFAQTETINGISFFYPGYLHEQPITDQVTARVLLAMMTQFKTSAEADFGSNIYFSGLAHLSVRNYYNMNRRVERGRRTEKNSADYISLSAQLMSTPVAFYDDQCKCIDFEGEPVYRGEREKGDAMSGMIFGLSWGIQRYLFKRLTLDFNLGPAYSTYLKSPLLQTNLTFLVWLGKREENYW